MVLITDHRSDCFFECVGFIQSRSGCLNFCETTFDVAFENDFTFDLCVPPRSVSLAEI